jgi:hypothetical protein
MLLRNVLVTGLISAAACGGGRTRPPAYAAAPADDPYEIRPQVVLQQWSRASTECGQGPYTLEVPVDVGRWREEVQLRIATPRAVALQVDLVSPDDHAEASGVWGGAGAPPDNERCTADAGERVAIVRGAGDAGEGTAGDGTRGGSLDGGGLGGGAAVRAELLEGPGPSGGSDDIASLDLTAGSAGRVTIRIWSREPNDLRDVWFGLAHVRWRPSASDESYDAHLAAEAEAVRARLAAMPPPASAPVVDVTIDPAQVERDRRAALEAEARAERDRVRAIRDRERAALSAALDAERRARRAAFCASHHDDRGCWGPGGYQIHLELEARRAERDAYCARAVHDSRCWSDAERSARRAAWATLVDEARAARTPSGPPPDPLAEVAPPRLSVNATWRPGYWHWLDRSWVWLAGQWRVPQADIDAAQTTTAPVAPPAPQAEPVPVAPTTVAVWIAGFWQWDGAAWVWVPGSWQLRPSARATWRPPSWRPSGATFVLVPGAWISIGGGR